MNFFDSHAHYYDGRFDAECDVGVDELIKRLLSDNVSYIVNVGTDPDTSRFAINQAKKFERMYTAIGIHPSDSSHIKDMDTALEDIVGLITDRNNKCVCLGEIGLDYHYPDTDRESQLRFFDEQMKIAEKLDIPICIHDRDSHADVLDVLRRYPGVTGVLHSFSGSVEMAKELIEMGYTISFSGTLTFTNARRPREVAAIVPPDKILIETDCPYLAPHPKRGTLNHSGNLSYTNAVLSTILGISESECATLTEQNAKRFFRLI